MMPISYRPLACAGVVLLALTACAASPPATAAIAARPAVDLGPSSRVATTRVAMAGAGHEMTPGTMSGAPSGAIQPVHEGGGDAHAVGTVNAVDISAHKINLSHSAIPALGWPAMTMDFPVAPSVDLNRIKPGTRVDFSLQKNKDGMFQVESVQPAGAGQ